MTTKNYQIFLILGILMGILNFNCFFKESIPAIRKYYVIIKVINNSSQDVELIDGFYGIKHNHIIKSGETKDIMGILGDDDETKDSPFKRVFGTSLELKFKNGKKLKYYCKNEKDKKCNVENNPLSSESYISEFLGEKDFGIKIQLQYQLTYTITEDQLLAAK